mmetsp:Transcript_10639/g.13858  ORF Transcript_10639/g.13858 Transcript_10639/m.13858 type:complete len:645 (+) Transcript_10639:159-2093(+)|eukprot:CAMPEP_0116073130 /NCGR_PEP_ID=MMETSP0322-20121206/15015_1 /TAXON_ID=163516 /ORGANISM="Leptocylindrus danicus var. apora, Strain B651" /LENGTH=644 /DNA_ID=CAMNT_0003562257 /DNA_START=121 /DNA_END=2055 /DNA_ORIENTATION=-
MANPQQQTSSQSYWTQQLGLSANQSVQPGSAEYEALRQKAWAEYYRRQQHAPTVTSAPAAVSAPVSSVASASTVSSNVSQSQSADGEYPESLKRYVRKCMDGMNNRTDEERSWVSKYIERVIANALKQGTLWSFDWDSLPIANPPSFLNGSDASTTTSKLTYAQAANKNVESSGYKDTVTIAKGGLSTNIGPVSNHSNSSSIGGVDYYNKNRKKLSAQHQPPSVGTSKNCSKSLEGTSSYYGPQIDHARMNSNLSSSSNNKKRIQSFDTSADFISLSSNKQKKSKKEKTLQKNKKKNDQGSSSFQMSKDKLQARANRFKNSTSKEIAKVEEYGSGSLASDSLRYTYGGSEKELNERDFERMTVKGTCTVLEKEFLRLNSPPKAELVRPQKILEKHLRNLKVSWLQKSIDYQSICSQLKAIRQDCTVQRINNAFTVNVYETHARVALESADLNEFNQCQTQLRHLYDAMLESRVSQEERITGLQNQHEFIAYKLLYYVFLTLNKKYEGGSTDLTKILLQISRMNVKEIPSVDHALRLRSAVSDSNYHCFFKLINTAPNKSRFLCDLMLPYMRYSGLQRIHKAYRPHVCLKFVLNDLGLLDDEKYGKKWLLSCGCKLSSVNNIEVLLTKDSTIHAPTLDDMKNSLI